MIEVRQSRGNEARVKARAEAAAARLLTLGLRPDDSVRFPRMPGLSSNIVGRPLDVARDGSVTCSAGGKVRAIRPEVIEVKMTGPRGGVRWLPLASENERED